jgi:hypothetical protein
MRAGSALLVVLVVIVMLALGAYTFSETMVSEFQATAMHGRRVQSRAAADSGIQYVATVVGNRRQLLSDNFYNNPGLFQNKMIAGSKDSHGRGFFSVVAPIESDSASSSIRFGLVDESSKANLNSIAGRIRDDKLDEQTAREILLGLPAMTPEGADAILDWLDPDDLPRRYGAESEFYANEEPAYTAKNDRLDTFEELLLVRGVTTELLYGEDTNRNGLLDANENDGDKSLPFDNGDNVLDRGWLTLLTVDSRERNFRRDGRPKINLNQESLDHLYAEVSADFGDDVASFIAAVRRGGQDTPVDEEPAHRQGGATRIRSIYDLIGAELTTEETGASLTSPWSGEPDDLLEHLPVLLDTFTTHYGPFVEGRININLATRAVLLTVPAMDKRLADAIVAKRVQSSTGQRVRDSNQLRATTAWLLIEGHVDLDRMRELAPYITTGGSVFRAQVVSYLEGGEMPTRLEALIDATYQQPRVISLRDLTDFGAGYSDEQLSMNGRRGL